MELSTTPPERPVRRRTRRDPKARFLPDISSQLDAIAGCAELTVPADHIARRVQELVGLLGAEALEAGYSSLGRHGHDPKRLLAVWIYASIIGIHHASKVALACETDAAFRLLAGGHAPSEATLKRFRARHGEFFRSALERTVQLAHERGLLKTDELALDSMRLRANASCSAIRHRESSRERVEALEQADTSAMSEAEQQRHETELERHRGVVETCESRNAASFAETNDLAALMRFPQGCALPGHRITATAAGASERIVIGVLVDAAPNDVGKLPSAVQQTLEVLERAGVPHDQRLRLLADAGYWDASSLKYAESIRDRVDVLIADARPKPNKRRHGKISRDLFVMSEDGRSVTCPAGRPMQGPESAGQGSRRWHGVGCGDCELRPRCTKGKHRKFQIRVEFEASSGLMRKRLNEAPDPTLYKKRAAIIEPVFASVQHEMGFRRASSRSATTVIAEVLLKLLAHNIRRLAAAASRLSVVWLVRTGDSPWTLWAPPDEF